MISRRTSSLAKEDVVFLRLLYSNSRCSQTCHRRSQACRQLSQDCRRRSQVLPCAPKVLSRAPRCSQTYHNHCHGTPGPVIRDPSYPEGRLECPPRVWYSPEIDASKFSLHILSDTPGGLEWLQYILLMERTTDVRIWHHVSCGACAAVSAALEVSHWSAQRSQLLQYLTILLVNSCSILNASP